MRRRLPDTAACSHPFCIRLCLAALLGFGLLAQEAEPVPSRVRDGTSVQAPGLPTQNTGHETEAATISKCLTDVRSEDVRLRRRAVMILGKYQAQPAIDAVLTCLRDSDAEVRRSAAVAVSEWDRLPQAAQPELLRLIVDENVHVRRVASSMLSELLVGHQGITATAMMPNREPLLVGPRTAPSAEVIEILNRALADSDVTIRRNVLTATRVLPGVLRRDTLEPCLGDSDREVRLLAVQAYGLLRGEEAARGERLMLLAGDTDVTVRREGAQALGRLGASGFAGLERLAEDADPTVRVRAVQELVQLQHPRGFELLEHSVSDESVPVDQRRLLLVYAGAYGERAKGLLTRLSTEPSALLRAEAIRGLGRLSGADSGGVAFLVACLEDPSVEVRSTAAQGLARWLAPRRKPDAVVSWPDTDDLARLLSSRYADVRVLAVRLSAVLPPEARVEFLTDACLDDDTSVRCEAILHLAMLGTAEADELVARSLDDPEPEVVRSAVRALTMRPSPQSRQLLESFQNRCTDPALKATVVSHLAAMGDGNPTPARSAQGTTQRMLPVDRGIPSRSRAVPQRPLSPPLPRPVP